MHVNTKASVTGVFTKLSAVPGFIVACGTYSYAFWPTIFKKIISILHLHSSGVDFIAQ